MKTKSLVLSAFCKKEKKVRAQRGRDWAWDHVGGRLVRRRRWEEEILRRVWDDFVKEEDGAGQTYGMVAEH
jgi:hypothetical protein